MPDYRSMFDRDYIGAWDLGGRDVVVTIAKVEARELVAAGGRKNKKPVVWFAGKEKALALNKTNAKTIAKLYSNRTENWVGKTIVIYPTTTSMGSETVDCIRVRPIVPAANAHQAETRNCPEHGEFYGAVCGRCADADANAEDGEIV